MREPRLDAGERAAIAMAINLQGGMLIDETRGRREAIRLGIKVVGACGLKVKARYILRIKKPRAKFFRQGECVKRELTLSFFPLSPSKVDTAIGHHDMHMWVIVLLTRVRVQYRGHADLYTEVVRIYAIVLFGDRDQLSVMRRGG